MSVVPQPCAASETTSPTPAVAAIARPGTGTPKLCGCSAVELLDDEGASARALCSFESLEAKSTRPVRREVVEPHIASVPVTLIVGGMLLVSVGVTRRIRRARSLAL